jgi:hypothetical protein
VLDDGGDHHPETDGVGAGRRLVAGCLFVEDPLVLGGEALPADLDRPRDPRQAGVVQRGLVALRRRDVGGALEVGDVLGVVVARPLPYRLRVRGEELLAPPAELRELRRVVGDVLVLGQVGARGGLLPPVSRIVTRLESPRR